MFVCEREEKKRTKSEASSTSAVKKMVNARDINHMSSVVMSVGGCEHGGEDGWEGEGGGGGGREGGCGGGREGGGRWKEEDEEVERVIK
ncbi:hypothetical protein L1987_58319 [Smallanthus sonchifolius]|uniref:Uncharacterized protein n=1 Tax=Smallanthus sonchifolius TaxID=185202 RepID=A0ACB9DG22_9ASTR|nr:hypothetical protein L1987_58319 [Smallanthus sonchifolius]